MKSLLFNILCLAGIIAVSACGLKLAGVRVHPADPMIAALVGICVNTLALIPILRSSRSDPVAMFQMAMVATVIHLLVQLILVITVIATRSANPYWLLGQYWASLAVLIWQLRQIIISHTRLTKAQQQ